MPSWRWPETPDHAVFDVRTYVEEFDDVHRPAYRRGRG